jgi:hypothetical protein
MGRGNNKFKFLHLEGRLIQISMHLHGESDILLHCESDKYQPNAGSDAREKLNDDRNWPSGDRNTFQEGLGEQLVPKQQREQTLGKLLVFGISILSHDKLKKCAIVRCQAYLKQSIAIPNPPISDCCNSIKT